MIKWIIHWYQKFTFHNVFSFQKWFTCKICWSDAVRLGNTDTSNTSNIDTSNNTDRNGVNKQNTHTQTLRERGWKKVN